MHIRTCGHVVFNLAVMAVDELQMVVVTDFYISEAGVRSDFAVLADFGCAFQPGVGINNGIAADFYACFDEGAGGIHDGYACIHQLIQNALAHNAFSNGKLLAGVDAHNHIAVGSGNTANLGTCFVELLQYVSQVIFALCIVVGQGSQHVKHLRAFHAVNTGVDFLDSLLLFGSIFLLYDALYIAVGIAYNAAVAERVIHNCRKYGSSSAAFLMCFAEFFQLFAVQQRSVAAQDERSAVEILQGIGSLHYSVAGAKLLGLQGDSSLIAYHCFYQLCFMAYDNNLFVCAGSACSVNYVLQHGLAAYLVQYLGVFAAHSCSFACGEDDCY